MKFLFLFLLALTGCSSMSSKPYVTEPAGSHKRAGILQNLFGVEGTTVEVPAPALKPEPKKRILENASEKENPLKVSKEKEQRKQMYEAQERAAVQPRATEDFSQALSAREKEEAMKKSNEASVKNASDGSKEGLLPPADNYKKQKICRVFNITKKTAILKFRTNRISPGRRICRRTKDILHASGVKKILFPGSKCIQRFRLLLFKV